MTVQIRPKGARTDEELYAPDRDIAYCFPSLVKAVLLDLRARKEELGADVEVAQASVALAKAFTLMTDPTVPDPQAALARAGFFAVGAHARQIVAATIGKIMVGAFFTAIRDVTPIDGTPPRKRNIDSLVEEASAMLKDFKR